MRELTSHKVNGCNEGLKVTALDEPGSGGACHVYRIDGFKLPPTLTPEQIASGMGEWTAEDVEIHFQNGPIKEVGNNGITHEALLAIIEDRLAAFQSGPYACDENAIALQSVRHAQQILKQRTEKRLARGVEGTHAV
jgi:hypothetical protein